jgi:predicted transcriptional regulator
VKIMDVEQKILRLLFEEEKKMNYRSIVDVGIHPNIARRRLDKLIKKGLVKEEGRGNWKRGKPLFYSLTKKGEETLFNTVLENLNETLKITERMLGNLLSKPNLIKKWRRAVREKEYREAQKLTEDMPIEERILIAKEETDKIYGPLMKSLWLMHQIVIRTSFPEPIVGAMEKQNMFIMITKKHGVYMIPEWILKEKGVIH